MTIFLAVGRDSKEGINTSSN